MPTMARAPDYGDDDHNGLPRFQLPQDGSDPLDAARTVERPALRNLVRSRRDPRKRNSESLMEIAPEDILLEAYVDEEPKSSLPPVLPKAAPTLLPPADGKLVTERLPMSSGPSNAYFVKELIATPMPQAAPMLPQHPVDQLLAMQAPAQVDTPNSIVPVAYTPNAYSTANVPAAPPSYATPIYDVQKRVHERKLRERRSFYSMAIVVMGVFFGVLVAMLAPKGTFAKLRGAQPAAQPPVTVLIPSPQPSPVAAPAPTVPSVAVESLPSKPVIEPNMTLVTFPSSAVGHRIYVDSSVLLNAPDKAMMKCGKHKVRIGSEGKAKKVDLPCGGEYSFE